jgi:hypothetical protein
MDARPRRTARKKIVTEIPGLIVLAFTAVVLALVSIMLVRGRIASIEGFISARRSMSAGVTALSLIISSLGAWILFSTSEATARTGILALVGYAVGSGAAIAILAWLELRMKCSCGMRRLRYTRTPAPKRTAAEMTSTAPTRLAKLRFRIGKAREDQRKERGREHHARGKAEQRVLQPRGDVADE